MRKFKRYSFFAALAAIFIAVTTACDGSDPENKDNYSNLWNEYKDNVLTLSEEGASYVESYEDDSVIQFSPDTPENLIPKEGTILLVPQSEKAPFGFLGKVVRVERNNGYKIFTEPAPLDEVFENLSIDGGIESIDGIEEVVDADGNPVEYELVDTLFDVSDEAKSPAKSRTGTFYLKNKIVRFPFKINAEKIGEATKIEGQVYAGFKKFNLSVDINNNNTSYVDLDVTPVVGLNTTVSVKLAEKNAKWNEKNMLIGKITLRAAVGPVILPIVLSVYGTIGATGEIDAKLTFNPEYSTNWHIKYKNGKWTNDKKESPTKNPWLVGEFDVSGKIYSGTKLGLMVGLYSSTVGIGVNITPKYQLGCSARLSSENILNINPLVEQDMVVSSEVYCAAKIFGKNLAKYSMQFPDYVLWNEKLYLLPQYEDFSAIGNATHGEISYKIDQNYFLRPLGFRHGLTVFESDGTKEIETAYPSSNKTDAKGFTYYNHTTKELAGGRTYYASPTIYGLNRKFHGEKHEFKTEATYHLGFRCVNQSYDVISFNFSLNDLTGNKLDYTTEATDYSGAAMRVHITGDYNANTNTLTGQFDFYFYEDPGQRRIDGFSVNLSSGDSGYVDCPKIVNNEGCYAAVRIYNASSNQAKSKRYNTPIDKDGDCNVGLFNKYFK